MGKVVILNHPLIDHKMAKIRDKSTDTKTFRENVNELSALMAYEITRDLNTHTVEVETPLAKTHCKMLENQVVLVPILRAGLGMVDGIQSLIPTAKVGHIGLYRDEETLKPHTYYAKFPKEINKSTILLLDPMLATGGTVVESIRILKEQGAKDIRYVGIVGCPEGVAVLEKHYPDIDIYLAALDEGLNDKSYIVPGLGDCGDRLFGTK